MTRGREDRRCILDAYNLVGWGMEDQQCTAKLLDLCARAHTVVGSAWAQGKREPVVPNIIDRGERPLTRKHSAVLSGYRCANFAL